jgi:hypothetical protein
MAILFTAAPLASAFTTDEGRKTMQSDGSYADTAAAVVAARTKAQDGWVLTVGEPGGSYTWPSQLVVDVRQDFTIQGASSANPTKINSTFAGWAGIYINAGTNKLFRMRNFSFAGWKASGRFIQIDGTGECFHLSNLQIDTAGTISVGWLWLSAAFTTGGEGPFGLIDHCTLNGYATVWIRQNRGSPDTDCANDHRLTWGTRKSVFIEDCTFNGSSSGSPSFLTDGTQAAKLVARHNTLNNAVVGWHGRDSGGTAGADYKHGFLAGEVYNNTYNVTRGMGVPLVMIRSGTALIWGNQLNVSGAGTVSTGAQLQTLCASGDYVNCLNASDGSPMRAPLQYPADYPDRQQAGLPQPVRAWSNGNPGAIRWGWVVGDSSFTAQNREYFVSNDDSAKPAGYTPFTYPHPLQSAGQTPRPSPPTNVRVQPGQ